MSTWVTGVADVDNAVLTAPGVSRMGGERGKGPAMMCPHPRGVTMTHLDLSWVVVALAVIALAVAIIILAKRVRSLESKVPQPIYNMTLHVTEGEPGVDIERVR